MIQAGGANVPLENGGKFAYRPAETRDIEAVAGIWMEMMEEHAAFEPRLRLTRIAEDGYAALLAGHLHSRDSLCLAAFDSRGKAIGFALSWIAPNLAVFTPARYGFISDVAVRRAMRGQGVGTELLRRTCDWMKAQGIERIELQVYTNNAAGREFWRKHGFAPIFERMVLNS